MNWDKEQLWHMSWMQLLLTGTVCTRWEFLASWVKCDIRGLRWSLIKTNEPVGQILAADRHMWLPSYLCFRVVAWLQTFNKMKCVGSTRQREATWTQNVLAELLLYLWRTKNEAGNERRRKRSGCSNMIQETNLHQRMSPTCTSFSFQVCHSTNKSHTFWLDLGSVHTGTFYKYI